MAGYLVKVITLYGFPFKVSENETLMEEKDYNIKWIAKTTEFPGIVIFAAESFFFILRDVYFYMIKEIFSSLQNQGGNWATTFY